ncbi:hypothetical protein SEA_NERGAL_55 [Mycobacterium Phage Nergal]|nr:hypothetical protein SEA_NERGAL_55 [Mycobacterium Phage Nergal]
MTGAPYRIGKPYDVGWAVFSVERLRGKEVRHVLQRFSTGADAIAAFRAGGSGAA